MDNLVMDKTKSTPEINFNLETGLLQFKGESYPENVPKFYTPILEWLKEYIELTDKEITLEFQIIYFNSSTSKVFMTIFDWLEEEVKKGKRIKVKWICDKDNETSIEFGEEFKEDLEQLPFEIDLV